MIHPPLLCGQSPSARPDLFPVLSSVLPRAPLGPLDRRLGHVFHPALLMQKTKAFFSFAHPVLPSLSRSCGPPQRLWDEMTCLSFTDLDSLNKRWLCFFQPPLSARSQSRAGPMLLTPLCATHEKARSFLIPGPSWLFLRKLNKPETENRIFFLFRRWIAGRPLTKNYS